MTVIWKDREAVVKLTVTAPGLALVEQRNGRFSREQGLAPDVRSALGADTVGYFEAERLGDLWIIKRRLPDSNRGW